MGRSFSSNHELSRRLVKSPLPCEIWVRPLSDGNRYAALALTAFASPGEASTTNPSWPTNVVQSPTVFAVITSYGETLRKPLRKHFRLIFR